MKNVLEIQRTDLLKFLLLLLLTPLATVLMGQNVYVDDGGGKIGVSTNEGDPGGPDDPTPYLEAIQMCFQEGDCKLIELSGFLANSVWIADANGNGVAGVTTNITMNSTTGNQEISICTSPNGFTGVGFLYLVNTPLAPPTNNGGSGNTSSSDPIRFIGIKICVSLNCPRCIYRAR